MATVSLTLYTIRLRENYRREYLPIDNFPQENDLHTLIGNYLRERHDAYSNDAENQHLFRISHLEGPGRSYKGQVTKGEYGYEADIINVQDFGLSYEKQVDDAEMFPFYFYIALPQNSTTGLLVLQRFGQKGTKTYFSFDLTRYFRRAFPEIMLDIDPLIPARLIQEYLENGRATKIRFVRYGIHSDITDAIRNSHEPGEGITEIIVNAKAGRQFPVRRFVQQILEGERDISTLARFRNFDFTNVKIEVEIGGTTRTIDLVHPENLNAELNISDDVETGPDGLPTFASVDTVARDYLREALTRLGHQDYRVQ